MNLVQIQERLKDLPTQAVMAYANGQNPQVPPYLALGELNRRKQMEQQAAQPPRGTVKDNIEQQVGLMQLQKARQGQMAQQSAMQGANVPTIPQGTPEPMEQPESEMAMAAGGLTSLPAGDMEFGSGGIIAFADEGLVDEAKAAAKAAKEKLYGYGLRQRQQDPEGYAAAQAESAIAEEKLNKALRSNADLGPAGAMGKSMIAPQQAAPISRPVQMATPQQMEAVVPPAPVNAPAPAVPPGGIVTTLNQPAAPRPSAPKPPAPPAAAPVSAAQKFQEGILTGTGLPALPGEYAPPKQAPIGEDYMKYMTDREQKRREDALKVQDVEAARAKRDFFNALIAGGEATRGQKGIGALFSGAGRSLGESMTAAEERALAFQEKQQQLADNDAKTRYEIANLRRAEERGDSKAVYESKLKIAELNTQRGQLQGQIANAMAQNESQERIARQNNLTQLEVARINQATAMKPGETERLMMQYAEIKRTKGEAAAEEFMRTIERVKTGTRGETAQQKLNIQRQALAEKLPAYQMAMTTYINATDPAKKAAALTKVRELEAMHGIKSEEAPTIDTSQWGNLKVK